MLLLSKIIATLPMPSCPDKKARTDGMWDATVAFCFFFRETIPRTALRLHAIIERVVPKRASDPSDIP
ncbi:MAG: hypothetical protein LBP64_07440 [Tannerella sp.]|nr:hypothetical protein [Tannerella sp.]